MKFGLQLNTQFRPDQDPHRCVEEVLEQVRTARQAGFDSVWVSHHYLTSPFQMVQLWPTLGRIAAESGEMRLGTSVFLLTLHTPAYAAEQAATMDVISGGRFIFGVGLGYRPEDFEGAGVDLGVRRSRFEECLDVMLRLWTEDEVTHRGRHFTLNEARLTMKPIQRPHLPVWIAASADPAVRRAGRYGFPMLINPHASLAVLEKQMALYHEALREHGHEPPAEFPIFKEVSVAKTTEEAFTGARPYLEGKYAAYNQWGLDKPMPKGERLDAPFRELAEDRFIIGTPDACAEEIDRYHRVLGSNHFLLRFQWPGMPNDQVLRQLELMGERVIPRWRR